MKQHVTAFVYLPWRADGLTGQPLIYTTDPNVNDPYWRVVNRIEVRETSILIEDKESKQVFYGMPYSIEESV